MLARAACPTWEGTEKTENEPLAIDMEVCLPDDPTPFKGHGSSLIARRRLSQSLNEFSGRCAGCRFHRAGKYGLSRDSLLGERMTTRGGWSKATPSNYRVRWLRSPARHSSSLEPGIQAAPSVIIRGRRPWMYVSSPCMKKAYIWASPKADPSHVKMRPEVPKPSEDIGTADDARAGSLTQEGRNEIPPSSNGSKRK